MKKFLSLIILIFSMSPIFSETVNEAIAQGQTRSFVLPTTLFVTPGFNVSLSGSPRATNFHSPGQKHGEAIFWNNFIGTYQFRRVFNTTSGSIQRDNILNHNTENYSYYDQPYEKNSPLGKLGLSYTTKSGEWTFDVSFRGKPYTGKYVLGNNDPFEYYPGTMEYNWFEGQYSIIRNHTIFKFLMVQPQIGIREMKEDYSRKSDLVSYPLFQNYSTLTERSRAYSQQGGLSFQFKILENFRLKLTGKTFQILNAGAKLTMDRTDLTFDGTNLTATNFQFKTNRVNMWGNELEGELLFKLNKLNFFLGYNYTVYAREGKKDPNYIPSITTTQDVFFEYFKYYAYHAFLEQGYQNIAGEQQQVRSRYRTIQYLYFGLSVNF